MTPQTLFFGDGRQRPQTVAQLRDCAVDLEALQDPAHYLAGPDLRAAVTTALLLGMPLLLTGEPGSGKSRLAAALAWELDLALLEFVVKSDTQACDLLYRYDAVARFHAGQAEGETADPRRFITFAAIGRALLHAKPPAYARDELRLPPGALDHPGRPQRSVVLIDEIDKAPRDVPNDPCSARPCRCSATCAAIRRGSRGRRPWARPWAGSPGCPRCRARAPSPGPWPIWTRTGSSPIPATCCSRTSRTRRGPLI